MGLVKKLEETERDITLTVFDTILYFYESRINIFDKNITPKNEIVLLSDFIVKYDEFAKKRGYNILGNLVRLGDLQSQILNRETTPGTIYFTNTEINKKQSKHGIIFYHNEIAKLRHGIIENALKEKDFYNANAGKLDVERIFISEEENFKGEGDVINKIEEIFKETQYKALEEKTIRQILSLDYSEELIEKGLNYLWDEEIINLDEDNEDLIRFNKKKSIAQKRDVKENG